MYTVQCEGFVTNVNASIDIPDTGIIPTGYYKVSDTQMAILAGYYNTAGNQVDVIPLGCQIDPITHDLSAIPVGEGSIQPINYACPTVSHTINYTRRGNVEISTVTNGSGLLDGYYYTDAKHQTPIPTGCVASDDNHKIYTAPQSKYLNTQCPQWGPTVDLNKSTIYNSANINAQYHDDASDISEKGGNFDVSFGLYPLTDDKGNPILDSNGKPKMQSSSMSQQPVTAYQPGSYTYGATTYVPSYEDSIYLSKTTGESQVTTLYNTADMQAGFCTQLQSSPVAIEQACNSMDINHCGSTSCCVLLGGSKCVSGNASGPTNAANYSDAFVQNKDYYYYQGKCYGNCQN